jgi:hypothetical protein
MIDDELDIISACTLDIETKLNNLSGEPFADKVIQIISQDDFESKIKMLKPPFAGVMYSGIRAEQAADSSRQGMAARLVCAVIFGFASISNHDHKKDAWVLMSLARNGIRLTVSPSGHKWRFVQEMYFDVVAGTAYYTQTWDTMAMLTSRPSLPVQASGPLQASG